jgi:translocator protein
MNHRAWNLKRAAKLILFILIAQAAGLIGTYFTFDAIPTWYASLAKPSFTPPNWIFGPVWTTLYTLMGVAAFFVWEQRFHKTHAARGMNWYWTQLALNAIWSPVFFGAKQMGLAFFIIVLMWCAILFTIRAFWKVSPASGALLIPYLAWVSFASAVNYQLWVMNVY